MRKLTIFIALLIIIVVSVPIIYAVFPQYQPAIGDFFGGLAQSANVLFTGFSEQFMQLPYWVAIFGAICFLSAILLDRWAWGFILGLRKNLVGDARRDSGLAPGYQGGPGFDQSQPLPPKKETQEIEAK